MSDVNSRTTKYLDEVARTLGKMEKDLPFKAEEFVSALIKGATVIVLDIGGGA